MQKRFASLNVVSVIWYMPTALDAGSYTLNGFQVRRHRQYVRATGLPAPSIWARAASRSGVMTSVARARNSGPYWRHVSRGVLVNEPITGKNSSVGLRMTISDKFTADNAV